jgi:hypothetical protein
MVKKYSDAELTKRVQSDGWSLVTGDKDRDKTVTGTLEDIAKVTHERHRSGKPPGRIKELETTIELDMIQIELLWRQLGLPV